MVTVKCVTKKSYAIGLRRDITDTCLTVNNWYVVYGMGLLLDQLQYIVGLYPDWRPIDIFHVNCFTPPRGQFPRGLCIDAIRHQYDSQAFYLGPPNIEDVYLGVLDLVSEMVERPTTGPRAEWYAMQERYHNADTFLTEDTLCFELGLLLKHWLQFSVVKQSENQQRLVRKLCKLEVPVATLDSKSRRLVSRLIVGLLEECVSYPSGIDLTGRVPHLEAVLQLMNG